ncbi:MAG: hypothetical protein Q8R78_05840 [Candidatus Omnitrophota bacterium]|nr:hypothetical protein [Candidatus Omnitrophota bacterium]
MTGEFEVEAQQLGRPDGHAPSAYGWDEGHILCALCHVQVPESVFFLAPCVARLIQQKEASQ